MSLLGLAVLLVVGVFAGVMCEREWRIASLPRHRRIAGGLWLWLGVLCILGARFL